MNRRKIAIGILVLILAIIPNKIAQAENDTPPQYPVYVVQEGDNLGQIALRFGVSLEDLKEINHISDPNTIVAGSELIIPGLTGIEGRLITNAIHLGDTLQSLSLRYQFPIPTLVRLNHIVSPDELYSGANLILLENPKTNRLIPKYVLKEQQPLLALAAENSVNPWQMILENQKTTGWAITPGTILYGLEDSENPSPDSLTPDISSLSISPDPTYQGTTAVIKVSTKSPVTISGSLAGYPLNFFLDQDGNYIAYQGIHAQQQPGLMTFEVNIQGEELFRYQFEQFVRIKPGGFSQEELYVDPATIDVDVNTKESQQILDLVTQPSSEKLWTTPFSCPVDPPVCIKSWFGTRRSYNHDTYFSFHTGLDLGVCSNLNVYATAPGKVIFADSLIVRGNALLIDHGWGIISGYYHLDSFNVSVGDYVESGQLIGTMGATGRVTGTHLHFELWVNGIQVNPLEWLDSSCQ